MPEQDWRDIRRIVRVLQEVVEQEPFVTYADLTEALKTRCAKLGVPYHGRLISDAIAQLDRGGTTPLIKTSHLKPTAPSIESTVISRKQAAAFFEQLKFRVPSMRSVRQLKAADIKARYIHHLQAKALRIVMDEIHATEKRSTELEAKVDHDKGN